MNIFDDVTIWELKCGSWRNLVFPQDFLNDNQFVVHKGSSMNDVHPPKNKFLTHEDAYLTSFIDELNMTALWKWFMDDPQTVDETATVLSLVFVVL